MRKRFEFKNNNVVLDICGEEFSVSLTADIMGEISDISLEAAKQLKELSSKSVNAKEKITETCKYLENKIDVLLGNGATRQIFKQRRINLLDLTDVLNYVIAEINTSINAKVEYYSGKAAK